MLLDQTENYVEAPPELIFLYHTWDRLIKNEYTPRPIPVEEFKEFLNYTEEWKPQNWPKAPKLYVALIDSLAKGTVSQDLKDMPETTLPLDVKLAFQGWKNYIKEGEDINALTPTYAQLQAFLKSHPHFARNYWRNIVEETTPNYLKSFTEGHFDPKDNIPKDEISSFLRVALYNFIQATK